MGDAIVFPNPPEFAGLYTEEGVKNGTVPQPPPVPQKFRVFGEDYDLDSAIVPALPTQGIHQVYPQPRNMDDIKRELKCVNRSILAAFLDLIQILIDCPESRDRLEKLDNIRVLFFNMNHLINELRPVQARATLVTIQMQQIKKLEILIEKMKGTISSAQMGLLTAKNLRHEFPRIRDYPVAECCESQLLPFSSQAVDEVEWLIENATGIPPVPKLPDDVIHSRGAIAVGDHQRLVPFSSVRDKVRLSKEDRTVLVEDRTVRVQCLDEDEWRMLYDVPYPRRRRFKSPPPRCAIVASLLESDSAESCDADEEMEEEEEEDCPVFVPTSSASASAPPAATKSAIRVRSTQGNEGEEAPRVSRKRKVDFASAAPEVVPRRRPRSVGPVHRDVAGPGDAQRRALLAPFCDFEAFKRHWLARGMAPDQDREFLDVRAAERADDEANSDDEEVQKDAAAVSDDVVVDLRPSSPRFLLDADKESVEPAIVVLSEGEGDDDDVEEGAADETEQRSSGDDDSDDTDDDDGDGESSSSSLSFSEFPDISDSSALSSDDTDEEIMIMNDLHRETLGISVTDAMPEYSDDDEYYGERADYDYDAAGPSGMEMDYAHDDDDYHHHDHHQRHRYHDDYAPPEEGAEQEEGEEEPCVGEHDDEQRELPAASVDRPASTDYEAPPVLEAFESSKREQ